MADMRQILRSLPVLAPAWRRISRSPGYRALRTDLLLLRRYGTRRPEKLQLLGSENFVFVDPDDQRGRTIIRGLGRGLQPGLRRIWHAAVAGLRPTIVLDVGLNYGEFLFAETYPAGTRLIGIEANPGLRRWISRSVELHPNRGQMEIVYALASDRAQERQTFYVDRAWSGGSSAVPRADGATVEECEVPSLPVDSLFEGRELAGETLLFKIDTEGYEPVVLRGMRELLRGCGSSLGIVEFDSEHLEPLGVDVDEYLRFLFERFTVYALDFSGRATRLREPRLSLLQEVCGAEHVTTDLLLASDPGLLARVGLEAA